MKRLKILLIDNYDSFTYNLVETVRQLDLAVDITVWRNDKFVLSDVAVFDKIMLSPGPGVPSEAGLLKEVIAFYAPTKPILGVCLGHQAIGEVFGAQLHNLEKVLHGIQTTISCQEHYLFDQVEKEPTVGRYHSWVINPDTISDQLKVIASDENGQVMAVCHHTYDVCGIQFHPESVMTPSGSQMLQNWITH
ncbi:MAG: anthranilate synthase component 2 [Marivirga sp.]|jgi:anthranilate synthase component 2